MIRIREAIIVEGRYDKNTLSQIVDAPIIETYGFSIMKDKKNLELIRRAAKMRGIIILTDSDGAGFVIRNYLKGAVDPRFVKHAYIPDISGKEKRKTTPGKEGKLGVEGMRPEVIIDALRRCGATIEGETRCRECGQITKQKLIALGLSGSDGSSDRRKKLLKLLNFPEHMSSNAMLQAVNLLYSLEEFLEIVQKIDE